MSKIDDNRIHDFPMIDDAYIVSTPAKRWYVVYIRPTTGSASRVSKFLERKGFTTYWPRWVRLVHRGRRERRVQIVDATPLLHRYLFVHLPQPEPPFLDVAGDDAEAYGVCGIVGDKSGPRAIPDDVLEQLIRRERNGEFSEIDVVRGKILDKSQAWAKPGAEVIIRGGPFAMFHGRIEENLGNGRFKVCLHLFGRPSPVSMGLDSLDEA